MNRKDKDLVRLGGRGELAEQSPASGAVMLPPSNVGRSVGRTLGYVTLFAGLPTLLFAVHYGITPLAPLIVLPRAAMSACWLASRRDPAYEDTSPALAAFVLSSPVWIAIAATFPALFAFDIASTVVWQLIGGGFLMALAPGIVTDLADLPRRILFERQIAPTGGTQTANRGVIRGQEVLTTEQVLAEREQHLQTKEVFAGTYFDADGTVKKLGFPWGGVWFADDEFSNNHRFIIGMSGGGKTLTFRLVMASLLTWPKSKPKPPESRNEEQAAAGIRVLKMDDEFVNYEQRSRIYQSVVYDGKNEHVTRMVAHGFVPGEDLFILNPLDSRCMVWDVAKDIVTPSDAAEFAELVVSDVTLPQNHSGTSEHFLETARRLVTEVVEVLQTNKDWRLRDLVNAFSEPEVVLHLLKQHYRGGPSQAHIKGDQEGHSAFSTLSKHFGRLSITAASWDFIERSHGKSRFLSLDDWCENGEGTVLLLPSAADYSSVIKPFNRFLFRRIAKVLLSSKELRGGKKRSIFLDELPTAGRLPMLEELLAKGRDYNLAVTIGVQDISQMHSTYGKDMTDTIINNCPYRAYMKNLGESAAWCSRQVGKQVIQWHQQNYGYSEGSNSGQSQGLNKQETRIWLDSYQNTSSKNYGVTLAEREQDALMQSFFSQIQDIESSQIVAGYYSTPNGKVWGNQSPLASVLDAIAWEPGKDDPREHEDFVAVEGEEQKLRAWDQSDFKRLGIPEPDEREKKKQKNLTSPRKKKRRKRRNIQSEPPDIEF